MLIVNGNVQDAVLVEEVCHLLCYILYGWQGCNIDPLA